MYNGKSNSLNVVQNRREAFLNMQRIGNAHAFVIKGKYERLLQMQTSWTAKFTILKLYYKDHLKNWKKKRCEKKRLITYNYNLAIV